MNIINHEMQIINWVNVNAPLHVLLRVNMTLETLVKLLKMHKQITNNVKKCNKIN
jgi:hypothetical protein